MRPSPLSRGDVPCLHPRRSTVLWREPPPHPSHDRVAVEVQNRSTRPTHAQNVFRENHSTGHLRKKVREVFPHRALYAKNERQASRRGKIPGKRSSRCRAQRGRRNLKQLLNTLYVSTQGAYLAKDGETVS